MKMFFNYWKNLKVSQRQNGQQEYKTVPKAKGTKVRFTHSTVFSCPGPNFISLFLFKLAAHGRSVSVSWKVNHLQYMNDWLCKALWNPKVLYKFRLFTTVNRVHLCMLSLQTKMLLYKLMNVTSVNPPVVVTPSFVMYKFFPRFSLENIHLYWLKCWAESQSEYYLHTVMRKIKSPYCKF